MIEDGRYSRTVRLGDEDGRSSRTPSLAGGDGPAFTGWLRVGHREDKTALELEISDGLGPVADEIVGRVRRQFDLDHPEDPEEQVTRLLAIKRIGPWTAGYIAMRTLGMNDVFLETDAGIKEAVAPLAPKEATRVAEQWRPWRSYATFGLWDSL